jgi:hypothetical protein
LDQRGHLIRVFDVNAGQPHLVVLYVLGHVSRLPPVPSMRFALPRFLPTAELPHGVERLLR